MTITSSPRLGLKVYGAGSDPHPNRDEFNATQALIDSQVAIGLQGASTARPTASIPCRLYRETDTGRYYWDTGSVWEEISRFGGGGPGAAVVPGAAAVEGTSTRAARADHTHTIALATASVDGAMAKADKAKLDGATSLATAGTLVRRSDGGGFFDVVTPTSATHAANKSYVDAETAKRALTAHTHAASDIVSGVLDQARLPAATPSVQGALSAADKTKLDGATSAATVNALVARNSGGDIYARRTYASDAPSSADQVTRKDYVDAQVGTRAPSAHTHAWGDIVSGVPASFTPSAHTHTAADITSGVLNSGRLPAATPSTQGALSAADKAKLDAATYLPTGSTLALRHSSGAIHVVTGTSSSDAANKGYVDTEVGKKANTAHTHDWSDIASGVPASFPSTWDTVSGKPSTFASTWATVSGKPTTFAPSAHTHLWADLTDKPATFPPVIGSTASTAKAGNWVPSWTDVTGKPSTFAPIIGVTASTAKAGDYVPSWGEVTGKPATFAPTIGTTSTTAKAGNYAPAWGEVTGKPSTFAPSAHGHGWADISGVPATFPSTWDTVSGKPSTFASTWATVSGKPTTFAPSSHGHSWSDITSGIPASFTPSAHTHSPTDIDPSGTLTVSKLRLTSTQDAHSSSVYHALQIGADTGLNLIMDNNEIVVRNNGVSEALYVPFGVTTSTQNTSPSALTRKDYVDGFVNDLASRVNGDAVHMGLRSPNGTKYLAVHNSGYVWSNAVYGTNAATGSYRALWVNDAGVLGYNLSSRKYKANERDYAPDLSVLNTVAPKWFQYTHDIKELGADKAPWRVNFMAEDLHDAGLTEYVSYDGKGTGRENVETINEQLMVSALWSFVARQQEMIAELTGRLDAMEDMA